MAVAPAYDYFSLVELPVLIRNIVSLQGFAFDTGLRVFGEALVLLLSELLDDIQTVALQCAELADSYIVIKIFESHTAQRQLTGNLESHIRSVPGPLGIVAVGLIEELDKVVNPMGGYHSFWRAQEYGTGGSEGGFHGGGVPTQVDRVLYGTFEPSQTPPDRDQAGVNRGQDQAFIPGGASPGWGTINVELPGRHFLRDGTAEAGARYVEKMLALQQRYRRRLRELYQAAVKEIPGGGGGAFGVIHS